MINVNEKLKEKYDGKSINEIEKEVKLNKTLSLKAKKVVTFALLYLRNSGRYKENPMYRKSSFENYLLGFHNIRINTFMEDARAFSKFEKESLKYGVGLVSKIHRKCGAKKEKMVLAEIKEAEKSLKTPIKRSKIEIIIQKHTAPKAPLVKQDYKKLYADEVRCHEITKQKYADVAQELKKAKEQIEKLKATVLELRPLRDMKKAILPFISSDEQPIEHRVS